MKYKTILFDLDGTLLQMDEKLFIKYYFSSFANKMEKHGYDPNKFVESLLKGVEAMYKNDGSLTNEEVFFKTFNDVHRRDGRKDAKHIEDFYHNEFDSVKGACTLNLEANKLVKKLKENGYQLVLATNPLFPRVATLTRIKWAGLDASDFDLISTYEDFNYCKPNPKYYLQIFEKLNLDPKDCLLVGNDVEEDILAGKAVGADTFLVPTCLLNKNNRDISEFEQGSFDDLLRKLIIEK